MGGGIQGTWWWLAREPLKQTLALRVRRLPMAANIQNGVCRWLGNLKVGRIELQAILYWLHWTKLLR
jgi:hypothetical protein